MAFGFPVLLDKPSGCATRPDSQQNALAIAELKQCSPFFLACLRCSAWQKGVGSPFLTIVIPAEAGIQNIRLKEARLN
jgi:hypothetical protein